MLNEDDLLGHSALENQKEAMQTVPIGERKYGYSGVGLTDTILWRLAVNDYESDVLVSIVTYSYMVCNFI